MLILKLNFKFNNFDINSNPKNHKMKIYSPVNQTLL